MADRILILIEDDWELQGNGLGNVAHLQYLPALFLMNLADELSMKITFMAEVQQQLHHRNSQDTNRNIRVQADLWDQTVLMMKERGHDVQLHLHPQWEAAVLESDKFRVNGNWNIATYEPEVRRNMIRRGMEYLKDLLEPVDDHYSIRSFKAGQWGLQPSGPVLKDLEDAGIRVVMGVGSGIVYRTADFEADYSGLEEDLLPYHPDYADITKVASEQNPLVVLPLPHYTLPLPKLVKQVLRRAAARGKSSHRLPYYMDVSPKQAQYSPMGSRVISNAALMRRRGDLRSLDIGSASFDELKLAIDQIMRRALSHDIETLPLVLQSHTKAYHGNWPDLTRFFRYMVDRYGSKIEFLTMSEFVERLPGVRVRVAT